MVVRSAYPLKQVRPDVLKEVSMSDGPALVFDGSVRDLVESVFYEAIGIAPEDYDIEPTVAFAERMEEVLDGWTDEAVAQFLVVLAVRSKLPETRSLAEANLDPDGFLARCASGPWSDIFWIYLLLRRAGRVPEAWDEEHGEEIFDEIVKQAVEGRPDGDRSSPV